MKTTRLIVAAAVGAIALSSAWAQPASGAAAAYGYSVAESQAERTIQITPDTRWVNVTRLETVRFVVSSGAARTSFTWRFDSLPLRPFDLRQVAPAGALVGQQINVYVGRNHTFDGGR